MPSYLVERYLPGVVGAEIRRKLEQARSICAQRSEPGGEVRHVSSYFLPAEETCFCRFDGDSADAVADVNRRAGFSFARVTEIEVITSGSQGQAEGPATAGS